VLAKPPPLRKTNENEQSRVRSEKSVRSEN
jgi:hypothetical protein